jgi:hypothetical protein
MGLQKGPPGPEFALSQLTERGELGSKGHPRALAFRMVRRKQVGSDRGRETKGVRATPAGRPNRSSQAVSTGGNGTLLFWGIARGRLPGARAFRQLPWNSQGGDGRVFASAGGYPGHPWIPPVRGRIRGTRPTPCWGHPSPLGGMQEHLCLCSPGLGPPRGPAGSESVRSEEGE